jgi:protein TonB
MPYARLTGAPLGIATLLAIVVHIVMLLSIRFDISPTNPPTSKQTIDISLIVPASPLKPEQADSLTPTNQQASNNKVQNRQASKQQAKPKPTKKQSPPVITQKKPQKHQAAKPDLAKLLTSAQQEIGLLTSAIDIGTQAASSQLKRKTINARTQDYKYAAYLDAWRKKIERVGNLNYPGEARRKNLYGSLRLQVAVRADGSLEAVRLLRSSGHAILDEAAKKIVRLAAPFAPFPENVRQEVDILDITRTWQFRNGGGLFSSN